MLEIQRSKKYMFLMSLGSVQTSSKKQVSSIIKELV